MQKVSESELHAFCEAQPDWALQNSKLIRISRFVDFVQAMAFVNRVAEMAEQEGHHPDIDIRYNTVTLGLVTHDAGGITERDLAMAKKLSPLF